MSQEDGADEGVEAAVVSDVAENGNSEVEEERENSGEGEETESSPQEENGEGDDAGEAQDRIFLFQWPDATVTIARSRDEETLKKEMALLGSIENSRLMEYTGPLQINLKLTPLPGTRPRSFWRAHTFRPRMP